MTENELTPNLKALLTFIESHAAGIIPNQGTFDPYGILIKRVADSVQMIFLEVTDDSADVLKGLPAPQMLRKVEDMIRIYRNDLAVESAAVVSDAYFHSIEGGEEGSGVRAWLDDRGKQAVLAIIPYEVKEGIFVAKEKWFLPKEKLFLPSSEDLQD